MELYREERKYSPNYTLALHKMWDVKRAVEAILELPYFALHQIQPVEATNPVEHSIRTRVMMARFIGDDIQWPYITDPRNMVDRNGQELPLNEQKYEDVGVIVDGNNIFISSQACTLLGRDAYRNQMPNGNNFYTDMSFDELFRVVSVWRTVHDAEFHFCTQEPKKPTKRLQV